MTDSENDAAGAAGGHRKTLIFHIGDHKTGSTTIQYAFARGQVTLNGARLFYPAALNHSYLRARLDAYARTDDPAARRKAGAAFDRLAGKIRAAEAEICLISAESLEQADPALLHEVATTYFAGAADAIRIIAYVRPHAARLLSNFAEQTKIGAFRADLESYFLHTLKNGRLRYQPRFAAWRAHFGDAFTLRPMIAEHLHAGSVLDDFIRHGLGQTGFRVSGSAPANESLCLEDLMRLKLLQAHCARHPQKLRHALGWEFARMAATLPPPEPRTRLRLHRALARKIHAAYLQDARAMDRDFFGGDPLLERALDTALETAAGAAQPLAPEDHLPAAEIRTLSLLSRMISEMAENETGDWVKFLRGKRIAAPD